VPSYAGCAQRQTAAADLFVAGLTPPIGAILTITRRYLAHAQSTRYPVCAGQKVVPVVYEEFDHPSDDPSQIPKANQTLKGGKFRLLAGKVAEHFVDCRPIVASAPFKPSQPSYACDRGLRR
jgi:hypothetical protein